MKLALVVLHQPWATVAGWERNLFCRICPGKVHDAICAAPGDIELILRVNVGFRQVALALLLDRTSLSIVYIYQSNLCN